MDYNSYRRKCRSFTVGGVGIGGTYPVSIQSMTNTPTEDKEATLSQAASLYDNGCDIVRIAVPNIESVSTIAYVKEKRPEIPLVADVHFDYKIALAAIDAGVDKIRINPGNIGERKRTEAVVRKCREKRIPIRIGVNSGSVERDILEKYGEVNHLALVDSALMHAKILTDMDFHDFCISVKASDVQTMLRANRLLAEKIDTPIHLGVTEAGARTSAIVKSSVGIGALLSEGIGDTVRVSLTDTPEEEIAVAKSILSSLSISERRGMNIVSCPTCGRTKIALIDMLSRFEEMAKSEGLMDMDIKVALMGCAVNGPGEAREADIGIAGGVGEGLLFKKGEIVRKIREDKLVEELVAEIKNMKDGRD